MVVSFKGNLYWGVEIKPYKTGDGVWVLPS